MITLDEIKQGAEPYDPTDVGNESYCEMTEAAFVMNTANVLFRLAPSVTGLDGYTVERLWRIAALIEQYVPPQVNEGRDDS